MKPRNINTHNAQLTGTESDSEKTADGRAYRQLIHLINQLQDQPSGFGRNAHLSSGEAISRHVSVRSKESRFRLEKGALREVLANS
jgi:hypothetical protein